jgi:hypothetical protein
VRALSLLALGLLLGCAEEDEGIVGHLEPCGLGQAPLLGCPPPTTAASLPSVEAACRKLVDCDVIYLDERVPGDDNPADDSDYVGCLNILADNDYPPDRLEYSLRCIEVSTCIDLRNPFEGPCFSFGGGE